MTDPAPAHIHHDPEPTERLLGRPPQDPAAAPATTEARDESERQLAFDSAFEWHGVPLLPFSSSRSGLFAALRLAMGAPPLSSCIDDMDAFEGDAHRILWLCTHTPQDWSILRTSPAALQAAVDIWADEHVHPAESLKASTTALRIYFASRRNEHESAPVAGKGHGDDLGN